MPYVNEPEQDRLSPLTDLIDQIEIGAEGSLNYLITKLALKFLSEGKENYARLSATLAQMEAAKLEFYRRKVAPYEDAKIAENGDVYE